QGVIKGVHYVKRNVRLHIAPDFLDDMIRGKGRGKRLVSRQYDLHPGEAAEGESQCGGGAPAALRCGSDSRRGQRDAPNGEPGQVSCVQFRREIRLEKS